MLFMAVSESDGRDGNLTNDDDVQQPNNVTFRKLLRQVPCTQKTSVKDRYLI